MRFIQSTPLDPDFVFDASQAALDERLVVRIGEIRTAIAAEGFQRADLLAGISQLLAFVGATPAQAVAFARDLDDQIVGSEVEMHHDVGGIHVQIVAGEPFDEHTDQTVVEIDGDPLISAFNQRERLVEVDADWPALDRLAQRTLLAFG